MASETTIHWFRQDLRLGDNPGLFEAAKHGTVLPVYILDTVNPGEYGAGAAGRWWLHHALKALDHDLRGNLRIFMGDPVEILPALAQRLGIRRIHWNRCYEPWALRRDRRLKEILQSSGVEVRSFNGSLLWEPWQILKQDGSPYKVFTPYYKNGCLQSEPPRSLLGKPDLAFPDHPETSALEIGQLDLLPRVRWDKSLEPHWEIGEAGASERLQEFLSHGLAGYGEGRDFPDEPSISRLSPHLHWGGISPNQVWHAIANRQSDDADAFLRQLCWREFSHYLLYHFPDLPWQNFSRTFDRFPWRTDPERLRRWQDGATGIPIVDAGMRELWQTGFMHNRIRMVAASFLAKNLLQHWHHGRDWFNDCLVDADLANNCAGWQWVAGCGADAAPYFRIFNPVAQGKKFDPHGIYTRRFVPELARLPDRFLFNPWEASPDVLSEAGVVLGNSYPHPMVDLKLSRAEALTAHAAARG